MLQTLTYYPAGAAAFLVRSAFLADRASRRWAARFFCILVGHLVFLPITRALLHPGAGSKLTSLSLGAQLYAATAHPAAAVLGLAAGGLLATGGMMLGGKRHPLGRWLVALGGLLSLPVGAIGLLTAWFYRESGAGALPADPKR